MGDMLFTQIWLGRLAFAGCVLILTFASLVPLDFTPTVFAAPDLMFCLVFAFVLRRPDFVPVWLIAGVFFLADILFFRPPGLWTAIVVLTAEFTRTQEYRLRDLVFPFEWAFVAATMFLAVLANRLMLSLVVVPMPGFGAIMRVYLVTAAAYPLVVFFCYFLLRIRKITPGEAIRFGHRL